MISEARQLLRYSIDAFVGPDPDGVTRITFDASKKTAFGNFKPVHNVRVASVPVSSQGKETPNHRLVILQDGRIAWGDRYSGIGEPPMSAHELEQWLAAFLAREQRA